jgi:hypothetical protein
VSCRNSFRCKPADYKRWQRKQTIQKTYERSSRWESHDARVFSSVKWRSRASKPAGTKEQKHDDAN